MVQGLKKANKPAAAVLLAGILRDARIAADKGSCGNWNMYEHFKKQVDVLGLTPTAYEEAIKELTDALEL